jgi:polar amino acid transport system substrate-binding protein
VGVLPLLAWAGAVQAQAQAVPGYPEIDYASPEQSVWTTRVNDRGEPENPLFRLASELFARVGIPWHVKTYPAARMFRYLEDGTAQFSILVKAPSLQQCCLLSRQPVASAEIRVYSIGQKPAVRTREDLAGKAVITVRGYSYAGLKDFIADGKNRIADNEAPSHGAAFRMLAGGRADYLIDYGGPAAEILAENPVPGVRYDVLSRQDVHLVLSRTYPEAEKVMARLEAVAESLDREKLLKR